jgi:C-terminal processing protease CtpA/Prc
VLTNEFSLSAGDAFPALFQDARRGPIVGMRTGGLGGNVNSYNYTGVTEGTVAITRSLIIRENAIPSPFGPTRFIENVGVTPDVTLDIMTRENLLSDGEPFVNGWLNEVRKLLQ